MSTVSLLVSFDDTAGFLLCAWEGTVGNKLRLGAEVEVFA